MKVSLGKFAKEKKLELFWTNSEKRNRDRSLLVGRTSVRKMDPRPIYFGFWCLMTNTAKLD